MYSKQNQRSRRPSRIIHLGAALVLAVVILLLQLLTAGPTPWLVPSVVLVAAGVYARYRSVLAGETVTDGTWAQQQADGSDRQRAGTSPWTQLWWVLAAAVCMLTALGIMVWLAAAD